MRFAHIGYSIASRFAAAWYKLRARADPKDRADPGCDQMRRFRREDRELNELELNYTASWERRRGLFKKWYTRLLYIEHAFSLETNDDRVYRKREHTGGVINHTPLRNHDKEAEMFANAAAGPIPTTASLRRFVRTGKARPTETTSRRGKKRKRTTETTTTPPKTKSRTKRRGKKRKKSTETRRRLSKRQRAARQQCLRRRRD